MFGAMYFFKKQREEDKRMKKKVLAFLLASTMVIESFSVASAADFSDGMGQNTVQFSDDAEDVPEVENDDVDQFGTDAVGEGENSSKTPEDAIQMGNDVWVEFDDSTGTATISGKGDMWDYYIDGWDYSQNHKNPFIGKSNIRKIIVKNGVTSIGNYFLYGCRDNHGGNSLEEVDLGENVKKIGDKAFENCYMLKTINLSECLEEIGENSFSGSLFVEKIIIPNSIKKIGIGCFSNCSKLSTVKLPKNLESISQNAFAGCRNLLNIELPVNLKSIEDGAFSGCTNLSSVSLPLGLEIIGNNAFSDCNITAINLKKSLTYIGDSAFQRCSNLTEINFEEGISCVLYGNVFGFCETLKEITIPETIPAIRRNAFQGCGRLTTVTIQGSNTQIFTGTFNDCSALRTIRGFNCSYAKQFYDTLDNEQQKQIKFESLGKGSHQFTAEKEQIKNPTCTEKGIKAYRCEICGAIKEEEEVRAYGHDWNDGVVTKEATESEEGEIKYTCWRCNEIKTESIPKLSAIKFDYVNFEWNLYDRANINGRANKAISYYITTVDKNSSAPEYSETHNTQESFQNGYFRIYITMPDEDVDVYIFVADAEGNHTYYKVTPNYNNRPQKPSNTVKVGNNITATIDGDTMTLSGEGSTYNENMYDQDADSIWYQNGINTDNIKHVIFKENNDAITRIGDNLFGGFQNLEDVKFPNGLLEIGDSAFASCSNLKNIDLPEKVRLIEQSAFSGTGISEINWPQNANRIPAGAFAYTNLKKFTVPQNVTEIGEHAFWGCAGLDEITIPESVKYIGPDTFMDCRNLTIYGFRDSTAESYAKANNINFVSVNYKVIFKDNGRTKGIDYVLKGENAKPPTLDEKPGYTLSWDTDYTNITEDMVINAVWTKKDSGSSGGGTTIIVTPSESTKYTVTFKNRGEVVKTEKVKSGDAAEYPFITRNGYKLSWDKDFSKITANITVNAVWTVIKPAKVTSLVAEADKKSIALSWDETEYTSYYLVYRKADGETEYTQIAKTTKVLWTDSKAVPGTQYSYKVVAVRSLEGKKYQGADSDVVTTKIGTPQIGDIYSVGDLNYKLTGTKEVTVTGLAKVTDTLVIPSSVTISGKVYKVTAIQDKAFYRNEDIVNVTIGNNVVNVGKYAFYQCSGLETVKFGKRVAIINTCAFTQCPNLENVTLPSSIRKIGAKAFYQCTSIKIFKINGSALEYVGKKGLAINKSVTLKLPKKSYSSYQKLIKASSVYVKTKFVKF